MHRIAKRARITACLLLTLVLFSAAAIAQETTGGIRGVVTDPSGGVVPGAKVDASSSTLVSANTTTTDATGAYAFPSLPPGTYTISASATGFVTVKQTGIQLMVGKNLNVNVRMEVGQVTESVVITGQAVLVDTTSPTVAANVTQTFFDHMPKGRNFDSLIALAPGARYESKNGGYEIDGASGAENVYTIDGMDFTNLQTGVLPSGGQVPFEFIQEIQVKSSGFEAQYGGAMGGVVNAIVRSGGNDWHGEAALYMRYAGADASPRPSLQLNPDNDDKAEYSYNKKDDYRFLNPGFSLGGPIKKDKLWIFASYFPYLWNTDRTVTFLVNKQTRTFNRTERTDFLTGKLDAAPFSKLRTYMSWIYSPNKVSGYLPAANGTDSPTSPWAGRGNRTPLSSVQFGGDYSITPKLMASVRGGYNYRNYTDNYAVDPRPYVRYLTSSRNIPGVPANLQAGSGIFTTNNSATLFDIQTRWRLNADLSYIFNAAGQHNLKGGYETNRLHNDANAGVWPNGYFRIGWNRAYTGVVTPGKLQGQYGYYIWRYYGTFGNVGSNNTSFFLQDNWHVSRRVTLNLGLRTEREFLPSFTSGTGYKSHAIEFGFGQKLAPRLGVALDVLGNGKLKLYSNFGLFYDLMKYEMPRGSFGGDVWKDYVYPLDDPNVLNFTPANHPGKLFEVVDWRIPSNDPSDFRIDPNLKPVRKRVYDVGAEYAVAPTLALSMRYTHNSLDRAIEDVGVMSSQGEVYYIANPGIGLTADPKMWGKYPVTPKAKREYNAIEIRADKRYANNFQFSLSYTWSRLYGNYGGLASSDENGRVSPNVNRYFDLPYMSYDNKGKLVEGLLATDRPHTLKFFGSYDLKSKLGLTSFGPRFDVYSGTPLTTEVQVVSSVPVYVNGRGDMGRTPVWSQTDLYVYHEFKLKTERYKVKVDFNFANLFNQSTITNKYVQLNHTNDGQIQFDNDLDFFKGFDYRAMMTQQKLRTDPQYGWANGFQGPRNIRFGLHFSF